MSLIQNQYKTRRHVLKVKVFYKSQLELSKAINKLIDAYWNDEIKEALFIKHIKEISQHNEEKLFKDNDYTKVIIQRCGKRRLELLDKILNYYKK